MEGLRPLGLGELLDAAIRIYRAKAKTLIAAVLVPVIPSSIVGALVIWSAAPSTKIDSTTGLTTIDRSSTTFFAAIAIVAILFIVATSMATAACFRTISTAYVGGEVDWKESLRFGFRRILPVIGLSLIVGLASWLGLLLCIVPGVLAYVSFAVAMPVLLVEGQGVFGSMRRSAALVKGMFWRVLGVLVVAGLLVAAFQYALAIPVTIVVIVVDNNTLNVVLQVLVRVISLVIAQPFTAAMTMALYVDLRVRKEGFDLVLWAQRLGGARPEGGFPVQPGAPTVSPVGWAPAPGYDPTAPPGYGSPAGYGPPPGYGPPGGYGPPVGYGPAPGYEGPGQYGGGSGYGVPVGYGGSAGYGFPGPPLPSPPPPPPPPSAWLGDDAQPS